MVVSCLIFCNRYSLAVRNFWHSETEFYVTKLFYFHWLHLSPKINSKTLCKLDMNTSNETSSGLQTNANANDSEVRSNQIICAAPRPPKNLFGRPWLHSRKPRCGKNPVTTTGVRLLAKTYVDSLRKSDTAQGKQWAQTNAYIKFFWKINKNTNKSDITQSENDTAHFCEKWVEMTQAKTCRGKTRKEKNDKRNGKNWEYLSVKTILLKAGSNVRTAVKWTMIQVGQGRRQPSSMMRRNPEAQRTFTNRFAGHKLKPLFKRMP